jgi:hypothetical protein
MLARGARSLAELHELAVALSTTDAPQAISWPVYYPVSTG